MDMGRPSYLFVSGCPRSGTTVMATLLNWSDRVFVAQERFAPLTRFHPEEFKPSLYTPSRMLDFRPGECGYDAFEDKAEYRSRFANPKKFDSLEDYQVIGDKITHLFRRFSMFGNADWRDLDVAVVHMVRNVQDVAASYQTRKNDAGDAWDWDGDDAVRDWTESVECAYAFDASPERTAKFHVVDYDWLFTGSRARLVDGAANLFEALGLPFASKQAEGVGLLADSRERFLAKRRTHPLLRARVERLVGADVLRKQDALRAKSLR